MVSTDSVPRVPDTHVVGDELTGAFDGEAYAAAIAILGHQGGDPPAFTLRCGRLYRTDPETASRDGAKVWTQINEASTAAAGTKPRNADIEIVRTLTWEYECPSNPAAARALCWELAERLIAAGLCGPGMVHHDSGAGVHTLVPIVPIVTAEHGGGEVVNQAIKRIVDRYVAPIFDELAEKHGLAGKDAKLGASDISRLLSMPGTWRPPHSKPDDAPELQHGYLRRWLTRDEGMYPPRVESRILTTLILAECAAIRAAVNRHATMQRERGERLSGEDAQYNPAIAESIRARAAGLTDDDRSVRFQRLVAYTALKWGENAVWDHATLIDEESGGKYGRRLLGELERSLSKVRQRDEVPTPSRRTISPVLEGREAPPGAPSDDVVIRRARLELLERKAGRYDLISTEIKRHQPGNHKEEELPSQLRSAAHLALQLVTWETAGYPGEPGADMPKLIYLPKVAAMAGVDAKTAGRYLHEQDAAGLVVYETKPVGPKGAEKERAYLATKRAPELTERLARPAPTAAAKKRAEAAMACQSCGSDDLEVKKRTIEEIMCRNCGEVQSRPAAFTLRFTPDGSAYRRREAERDAAVAEQASEDEDCPRVPTHADPTVMAARAVSTTREKTPCSKHVAREKTPCSDPVRKTPPLPAWDESKATAIVDAMDDRLARASTAYPHSALPLLESSAIAAAYKARDLDALQEACIKAESLYMGALLREMRLRSARPA